MGEPCAYIAVPGTWGFKNNPEHDRRQWWHPGSSFHRFMVVERFELLGDGDPMWSTGLEGHEFWLRLVPAWARNFYKEWEDGKHRVARRLMDAPYARRNVLVHSHGVYPLLLAVAMGIPIRRLISFGSPRRADMADTVVEALPLIGRWAHVYHKGFWGDLVQHAGGAFDRYFGFQRKAYWTVDGRTIGAHEQIGCPGIGHSSLLQERPELVREFGLLDFIRRET